jgi:hypothetical protein
MRNFRTLLGWAILILAAPYAWAGDEVNFDRSIVKEPAYQSSAPRYGLLTLGREGKTRVWLVFDIVPNPRRADTDKHYLYVDRNGNGDLTENGERVEAIVHQRVMLHTLGPSVPPIKVQLLEFLIGEIKAGDGTIYKDVKLIVHPSLGAERPCTVYATVPGCGVQRSELNLVFANRPEDAPVVRFGSSMTMRFALGMTHRLSLSQEFNLQAEVGTSGVGAASFVSLCNDSFPKDIHPIAEIEWPHREAGKPPIKRCVTLNQRC